MNLDKSTEAVKGAAAAIRIVTRLEPVGHARDKVFPPTYAGGEYALEERYPGAAANVEANGPQSKGDESAVHAVLLHSVAGQANLLEEAPKTAIVETRVRDVPVLKVSFDGTVAAECLTEPITVLDAPHRVFDAIFRDSEVPAVDNGPALGFSETEAGRSIAKASLANATPLFEWSPTSLLFGCWNSANDKVPGKIRGNLKFARAIVSEIVGYEIEQGVRVGGKGDPAGITGQAIYRLPSEERTTDVKEARHDSEGKPWFAKKGAPSQWTQVEAEAEKKTVTKDQKQQEVPVYQAIGWQWTTDENQAARNKDGKPVKWGKKGKPMASESSDSSGRVGGICPCSLYRISCQGPVTLSRGVSGTRDLIQSWQGPQDTAPASTTGHIESFIASESRGEGHQVVQALHAAREDIDELSRPADELCQPPPRIRTGCADSVATTRG
jgi:CRISPR-associated protein Csb1